MGAVGPPDLRTQDGEGTKDKDVETEDANVRLYITSL